MSDAKEVKDSAEAPAKKKGKLPVIIAVVVVLLGGGFFGMKMKGGGAEKKPAVELGEIVPVKEFLVNTLHSQTFLRAEVALQMSKTFKAELMEKNMMAIQDIIRQDLSATTSTKASTIEGQHALKKQIAEDLNKLFNSLEEGKESKESKNSKDSKDADKGSKDPSDSGSSDGSFDPNDWDSKTGPVLKVYFTSFATQ